MLTRKGFNRILGISIVALLLTGCSTDLVSHSFTPLPTAENTPVLNQAELEEVVSAISEANGVPGLAIAVVTDEGLQYAAAAGVRKWGDPTAVTPDDSWPIGSDTKMMTAALASILVDEGKLHWDSTVSELFPEMAGTMHPDFQSVTLQQLLSHSAGLPHNLVNDPPNRTAPVEEQRAAITGIALAQKPSYPPGTAMFYSNLGYVVAGAMIERAAEMDWESAMEQYLFTPLGMNAAGTGAMGTVGEVDQPWGHYQSGPPRVCCSGGAAVNNPLWLGPAGTVHCTLQDWALFIADQLRGARGKPAFLSPETYAMVKPNDGNYYAMGWALFEGSWAGGTAYRHSGSNGLYWADAYMVPDLNFAVLVASNAGGDVTAAAAEEAIVKVVRMIIAPGITENPVVSRLEYGIVWVCLAILLSMLFAVPILLWRIKDPPGTPKSIRRWVRAAAWLAWFNSLLFAFFFYISAVLLPLEIFAGYPAFLVFDLPLRTHYYEQYVAICIALTIIQVAFTIMAWKGKLRLRAERIYFSLATLASAAYILLLINWGFYANG